MADLTARIAQLWRYPVKSCAGEAVDTLTLGADGWPEGDRGWGVVDRAGELTWMGAHARLALVQASLTPEGLELQSGDARVIVPRHGGEPVTLRGWNGPRQDFDLLQGWDAGDEAAALLHDATGQALRLVRLSVEAQRRPFLNALHLVGDGSLQAWQDALAAPLGDAARRSRPNVVLQAEDGGLLTPFIEDLLAQAHIGSLVLQRTGTCERCLMTTVDPQTADLLPAALDALARLSAERAPGAPVQFGVYARGRSAGVLRVGDPVELTLAFGNS